MTIADDIHTILNGLVQPRDVQRVCQMVSDLESQLKTSQERSQALSDYAAELEEQRAALLAHVHGAIEQLQAAVGQGE